MGNRIVETIITTIIAAVLVFLGNLVSSFLFGYSPVVQIGESMELDQNSYILPINISTFNNDINNLRIQLPGVIQENQLRSNSPVNIKKIANNVGYTYSSIFEVENVPAKNNLQLVIETSTEISDDKVTILNNKTNLNVKHVSEFDNPLLSDIRNIIMYVVIYSIMLSITTYYTNKHRDQKIRDAREKMEHYESLSNSRKVEVETLRADVDELIQKTDKVLIDERKRRILLFAKLNDYRKELNFWRNTIRKILYQLTIGERKAEELLKIVSSSLKTYQTNEKHDHDFETLKVLSSLVRDIDNDINDKD